MKTLQGDKWCLIPPFCLKYILFTDVKEWYATKNKSNYADGWYFFLEEKCNGIQYIFHLLKWIIRWLLNPPIDRTKKKNSWKVSFSYTYQFLSTLLEPCCIIRKSSISNNPLLEMMSHTHIEYRYAGYPSPLFLRQVVTNTSEVPCHRMMPGCRSRTNIAKKTEIKPLHIV